VARRSEREGRRDGLEDYALLETHRITRIGHQLAHVDKLGGRGADQLADAGNLVRDRRVELLAEVVDLGEGQVKRLLHDVARRCDQVQSPRDVSVEELLRVPRLPKLRLAAGLPHAAPGVVADGAARLGLKIRLANRSACRRLRGRVVGVLEKGTRYRPEHLIDRHSLVILVRGDAAHGDVRRARCAVVSA
jgi:hypothetical protein